MMIDDNSTAPDGTAWMSNSPDPHSGDYVMRDGVLRFVPRNGDEPYQAMMTVDDLRSLWREYTEFPPPAKVTP